MKNSIFDLIEGLESKVETLKITFNNQEVEVKSHISLEDKRRLVQFVINQNRRNKNTGMLSSYDIDRKLDIALVNYYTNFKFDNVASAEMTEKAYEVLDTSGFFQNLVNTIPKDEYDYIQDILQDEIEKDEKFRLTLSGSIDGLLEKFGSGLENLNQAMQELEDFDVNNFENVKDLAAKLGINNGKTSNNVVAFEKKDNKEDK